MFYILAMRFLVPLGGAAHAQHMKGTKAMALPWVQGRIVGEMRGGRITAQVVERRLMEGDRPRSLEEAGASREFYEKLRAREEDFDFETFGFMGGAVAWVLPTTGLELLPLNWMDRLERHNGGPLPDQTYVALVRNAGAPTIQFCAEPAGGMQEDPVTDWLFDLLDEGLELGAYDKEGWLAFRLPPGYERYQVQLEEKQAIWWAAVRPDFPPIGFVAAEFLPIGDDTLDGESGIIVPCLAAGEWSFLKTATLHLPPRGKGWKVCDLECRRVGDRWEPLNRAVVGITPREGRSPMLWRFSPDGGLDHCGPHFPLAGEEVIESVLSHLSIPLLGPRGLNWLLPD